MKDNKLRRFKSILVLGAALVALSTGASWAWYSDFSAPETIQLWPTQDPNYNVGEANRWYIPGEGYLHSKGGPKDDVLGVRAVGQIDDSYAATKVLDTDVVPSEEYSGEVGIVFH